jgi:hypothetical protein
MLMLLQNIRRDMNCQGTVNKLRPGLTAPNLSVSTENNVFLSLVVNDLKVTVFLDRCLASEPEEGTAL